jgi:hypothetical protein
MKNSNHIFGNRTRDLLTCSAVPQPTAPPRVPVLMCLSNICVDYEFVFFQCYTNIIITKSLGLQRLGLFLCNPSFRFSHRGFGCSRSRLLILFFKYKMRTAESGLFSPLNSFPLVFRHFFKYIV